MRSRLALAVVGGVVGGLAWTVAAAGPAFAHAELESSDPGSSARLDAVPDAVTLRFTEAVGLDLGFLRVVDESGERVDDGQAEHPDGDQRSLTVGLRDGLGEASYVVSWRVVSADSHPIEGAYSFVVGDGPLAAVPAASGSGTSVEPVVSTLFAMTRWVGFAGIALLLGGAVFLVFVWPEGRAERRPRALVWTGWGLAAGSTAFALPLQGLYASGRGLAQVASTDLLDATLHTNFGRVLSARLVLLAVLGLLLDHVLDPVSTDSGERRWQVDAAGLVGLATLATWGASGHAAAGIQPPLAVLGDAVHLAAMSVWTGGLAVLATCLLPRGERPRTRELAAALPVFSRIALCCVATLLVTGIYQGWREVGTVPALWRTSYGQLLLVKVCGFAALVGLGYVSRAVVQRRYVMPVAYALSASDTAGTGGSGAGSSGTGETGGSGGSGGSGRESEQLSRLRRSVGFEVVIAATVLAVTAVLIAQPPARATYSEPYSQTLALDDGNTVQVEVRPAAVGLNTLQIYVFDSDGRAFEPLDVTVRASLPSKQLGPLDVVVENVGPGRFQGSGMSLPQPGTWHLQVSVRTAEFDESGVTAKVRVT